MSAERAVWSESGLRRAPVFQRLDCAENPDNINEEERRRGAPLTFDNMECTRYKVHGDWGWISANERSVGDDLRKARERRNFQALMELLDVYLPMVYHCVEFCDRLPQDVRDIVLSHEHVSVETVRRMRR